MCEVDSGLVGDEREHLSALRATAREVRLETPAERRTRRDKQREQIQRHIERAARRFIAQGMKDPRELVNRVAAEVGRSTTCVRDYLPAILERLSALG